MLHHSSFFPSLMTQIIFFQSRSSSFLRQRIKRRSTHIAGFSMQSGKWSRSFSFSLFKNTLLICYNFSLKCVSSSMLVLNPVTNLSTTCGKHFIIILISAVAAVSISSTLCLFFRCVQYLFPRWNSRHDPRWKEAIESFGRCPELRIQNV